MVSESGVLGRWSDNEGQVKLEPMWMGLVLLKKGPRKLSPLACENTARQWTRKWALTDTVSAHALILDFPAYISFISTLSRISCYINLNCQKKKKKDMVQFSLFDSTRICALWGRVRKYLLSQKPPVLQSCLTFCAHTANHPLHFSIIYPLTLIFHHLSIFSYCRVRQSTFL